MIKEDFLGRPLYSKIPLVIITRAKAVNSMFVIGMLAIANVAVCPGPVKGWAYAARSNSIMLALKICGVVKILISQQQCVDNGKDTNDVIIQELI